MAIPARSQRSVYLALETVSFDDCLDLLTDDLSGADPQFVEISGCRAVVVHQGIPLHPAPWCTELNAISGLDITYQVSSAGAVLIVEVEDSIFAIGFGGGSRWLASDRLDGRFGLRFAIRSLDPDELQDVVKRTPGLGRTDITLIPAGATVWQLGVDRIAQIVRRLGGKATFADPDGQERTARVEGGSALRFGVANVDETLIAELSEIVSTLRNKPPVPQLEFVEHIVPITDAQTRAELDTQLELLLGAGSVDAVRDQLAVAAPEPTIDVLPQTTAYVVKIGGARAQEYSSLELGQRLTSTNAFRWLEAVVGVAERRFFLLDAAWYEIGAHYLTTLVSEIEDLVADGPDLDLPAWQQGQEERGYNEHVQSCRRGFICLDRQGVVTQLHRRNGVEICDLLGPDDELIHVKRAASSAPLSHLFNQGLVSAQSLTYDKQARAGFAAKVRERGGGRQVNEDFVPRTVVFAIQLKAGEAVTPRSLFPFAQVALRQAARGLHELGATVHVVTIPQAAA
ncbi:MAG: TIGR04141 family sporadically distributed protein [Kineosporiaceae bacterium]|nr:TIGR04141 family sporadically distributed protein [Kineosporiaceae bacterium]